MPHLVERSCTKGKVNLLAASVEVEALVAEDGDASYPIDRSWKDATRGGGVNVS
jgi:hypothetical protein